MNGYVTKFVPREQYELVRKALDEIANGKTYSACTHDHRVMKDMARETLRKAQEMEI